MKKRILFWYLLTITSSIYAQTFYRGNDLSYVNQMEDCGAVFRENGIPKDVFRIFADQGTNLVRVRLWHNPSWQNGLSQPAGVKPQYSDFEDVKQTILRAKNQGMEVMLDIHLSDFWADPGQQLIPSAWTTIASNVNILSDSVYNYITKVLTDLHNEGLMPEIVKIGNENNGGILRHTTLSANFQVSGSVSTDWGRHARLFNAGIRAVRDISRTSTIKPKVALHFSGINNAINWYQRLIDNGVTDFDIIGITYYYSWHGFSIKDMGNTIRNMRSRWPMYDVMVVETGYLWTTQNHDALGNIITTPDPQYLPVIPEKQLEYMVDLTREVKRAGGIGVVFWEPAWVSTPCSTPWGVGSSHDHVAFFEPGTNNWMNNGGGKWTNPDFYTDINSQKVTFKVDMGLLDTSNGVYIGGTWSDGQLFQMGNLGNNIFSYFTYLPQNAEGGYFFVSGPDISNRETVPGTCALWNSTDRRYIIPANDVSYAFQFGSCNEADLSMPYVTFMVDMTGQDVSRGVFIVGEVNNWSFQRMSLIADNIYSWTTRLNAGSDVLAYYYITNNTWTNFMNYRETVPPSCRAKWTDRGIVVQKRDTIVRNVWGSCATFGLPTNIITQDNTHNKTFITTNSNSVTIHFNYPVAKNTAIEVFNVSGVLVFRSQFQAEYNSLTINLPSSSKGLHLIRISGKSTTEIHKVVLF